MALDQVQVLSGLTEQEQKEAAAAQFRRCRDEGKQLAEEWLAAISLRVDAARVVQEEFASRFDRRYGGADPTARNLAARLGIGLRVDLKADPAATTRGTAMLEQFNTRCKEIRDLVLADVETARRKNIAILIKLLKLRDDREQVVVKSLLAMVPEFLPYFRSRPDYLLRFLEFAVCRSTGPVHTSAQLKQLLSAFNNRVAGPHP